MLLISYLDLAKNKKIYHGRRKIELVNDAGQCLKRVLFMTVHFKTKIKLNELCRK